MDLNIVGIDRFSIKTPYRPIVARNMMRELPHWDIFEICKVTLHNGVVGYGETMSFYTWGATGEEDLKRAWCKNAAELMWDDSLGSGLQMALFDAVARAAEVPIHALLGRQVRDRAHVSWWDFDMPPADLAAECALAHRTGYTSFKTKARPWWDLYDQLAAVAAEVPESFDMDFDFNATLLNADHAERILPYVEERFPIVAIWESPIPQGDVAGGRRVQQFTRAAIAHHYGSPDIAVQLGEDLCDGFVVGGGATAVLRQGAVCESFKKPFWLQQVGTGITAAFSLHFAAVCDWARWPAVNCHQLYENDLLKPTFPVQDGTAAIPDGPGLGVELDLDALEQFRIDKPEERPFGPDRLLRVIFPSGPVWHYAHGERLYQHSLTGELPVFQRGVRLEMVPDDGTQAWRDLHARAMKGPVQGE